MWPSHLLILGIQRPSAHLHSSSRHLEALWQLNARDPRAWQTSASMSQRPPQPVGSVGSRGLRQEGLSSLCRATHTSPGRHLLHTEPSKGRSEEVSARANGKVGLRWLSARTASLLNLPTLMWLLSLRLLTKLYNNNKTNTKIENKIFIYKQK